MLYKIETPLGKFIMKFGAVESAIRAVTLGILRYNSKTETEEKLINYISSALITSDSLTVNLNILNQTVDFFVEDNQKENWKKVIEKARKISEFRNLIVHGLWSYNQSNEVVKTKKKGIKEEIITDKEITKKTAELNVIYEQLMDFMQFVLSKISTVKYYDFCQLEQKLRVE